MRSRSLPLSMLLAAVVLVGCRGGNPGYVIGAGDEYVALGDSYTAAPGTGARDGNDGCLRSRANYPHKVADATGADLADVSCSGATSDALVSEQTTRLEDQPPQLDALSESTDLVTMGIGANDFNLIGRVVLTCPGLAAADPEDDQPCSDADRVEGGSALAAWLDIVEDSLVERLADIDERAPDATVLVIGYPQFVPEEGTCDLLPIADGDYPWARRFNEGINDALESAAERGNAEYVDVYAATRGHDICADDPWVAGARVTRLRATPWHPHLEEQEVVADLILAKLEE